MLPAWWSRNRSPLSYYNLFNTFPPPPPREQQRGSTTTSSSFSTPSTSAQRAHFSTKRLHYWILTGICELWVYLLTHRGHHHRSWGGKLPLKINTIIILWGLLLSSLSLPCHFIFFSMLLLYKRTLPLLLSVTPTTTLGRFGWQGGKEWKEDATDELIRSIPLQRETHAHSQESPAVEWIWEKM